MNKKLLCLSGACLLASVSIIGMISLGSHQAAVRAAKIANTHKVTFTEVSNVIGDEIYGTFDMTGNLECSSYTITATDISYYAEHSTFNINGMLELNSSYPFGAGIQLSGFKFDENYITITNVVVNGDIDGVTSLSGSDIYFEVNDTTRELSFFVSGTNINITSIDFIYTCNM